MWSGSNPTSATRRNLRRWYQKKNKKRGRPKKYTDAEILQQKINAYFDLCDKLEKPYTMSGLALALDMDRKTLLNYSKEEEFFPTIKKAKNRIEEQLEENSLMGKYNPTFAIFNLKNNFDWKDKQQIDTTSTNRVMIVNDLPSDVDDTT